MSRIVEFIIGVVAFFGGWSLFGAGFDFIDAHRDWSPALLIPVLVAAAVVMTALVVGGAALAIHSITPRDEEPRP